MSTPPEGAPAREPGKATGLPFPRTGVDRYVAFLVVFSVVGTVMPLMVLGERAANVMTAIREAGPGMGLLVLFALAAMGVVTPLGMMVVRGRGVPVAAVVGAALAPMAAAIVVEVVVHRQLVHALGSVGTEGGTRLRLAFQGMSGETNTPLYAALACGMLLLSAAVASAGVLGTIDYARLSFRAGPSWLLSLAISFVWVSAGLASVVSAKPVQDGLSIFELSVAAQLIVVALATVSTRASVCLPGWHDPEEARHIAGALVCAALASSLSLVLIDRAVLCSVERQVWSVAADSGMDANQRARILHEWVVASRTFSVVTLVHGMGAVASFGPAIVRAHRRAAFAISRSAIIAFALFVVTLITFYGVTADRAGYLRESGAAAHIDTVWNGDLPVVPDASTYPRATRNPVVLGEPGPTSTPAVSAVYSVAAARTVTVASVADSLGLSSYSGPRQEVAVELVVRSEVPVSDLPLEPEIAALVPRGPPVVVISLSLPIEVRWERQLPQVRVAHDLLRVATRDGLQPPVPPGPTHADELRAAVGAQPAAPDIYVGLARDVTLQEVVFVLTTFDRGWERVHVLIAPPSP